MDKHLQSKVAYRDVATYAWLAQSDEVLAGNRLAYASDRNYPGDVPHPQAVFSTYVDPADRSRPYLGLHNGKYCYRVGQLPGGWTVFATATGPALQVSHSEEPGGTPERPIVRITTVATGEGLGRVNAGVQLVLLQKNESRRFELFTVTHPWDSPQSWLNADLTNVDFRGMASVLTRVPNWTGANMAGANFEGMDLRQVRFDAQAKLAGARLVRTNFANHDFRAANLDGADLTGANLAGAKLASASMVGTNFAGANLTGATFGTAPRFSKDPSKRTSFRGATLDRAQLGPWAYLDLRGTKMTVAASGTVDASSADLSEATVTGAVLKGGKLDGALLASTDLRSADVTGASFGGCDLRTTRLPANLQSCRFEAADLSGVVLVGANLTGASLRRATLRGAELSSARMVDADCREAQLGATKRLFALPGAVRAALADADGGGALSGEVREAFAAHGVALTPAVAVTESAAHGGWLLADGDQRYRIVREGTDQELAVHAYLSLDQAAVLTSAYMPNAIFDNAELYAVNMSGAHWYGGRASAVGANLEQIDASNANLGQISLTQAKLMGAGLSTTVLAGANLRGAQLGPSAQGVQSSLPKAHLAGADLTGAVLHNAVMTDASVAIEATAGGTTVIGVPLFPLATSLVATLDAGQVNEALRAAFASSGYPLARDAAARKLSTGQAWEITQGHDDPQQTTNRYARFGIVLRDGQLHVHGSELWITRLGSGGNLETVRFAYAATKLSEREMNPQTTLPNGKTLQANQAENRPWHQMVTALNRPPTPPECIPDPDSWNCPAPTSVRATEEESSPVA